MGWTSPGSLGEGGHASRGNSTCNIMDISDFCFPGALKGLCVWLLEWGEAAI